VSSSNCFAERSHSVDLNTGMNSRGLARDSLRATVSGDRNCRIRRNVRELFKGHGEEMVRSSKYEE
jgi:hypothetical protein